MPRPQSRTQLSNKPNSSAASSNPISAWLARREERKQAQAAEAARAITGETSENELKIQGVLENIDFIHSKLPTKTLERRANPEQKYGDLELAARALTLNLQNNPVTVHADIRGIDKKLYTLAELYKTAVEQGNENAAYAAKAALARGIQEIRCKIPTSQPELINQFVDLNTKYLDQWITLVGYAQGADQIKVNLEKAESEYKKRQDEYKENTRKTLSDIKADVALYEAFGSLKEDVSLADKDTWSDTKKKCYNMLLDQRLKYTAVQARGWLVDANRNQLLSQKNKVDILSAKLLELPIAADPDQMNKYKEAINDMFADLAKKDQELKESLEFLNDMEARAKQLNTAPGQKEALTAVAEQRQRMLKEMQDIQEKEINKGRAAQEADLNALGLLTDEQIRERRAQLEREQQEQMEKLMQESVSEDADTDTDADEDAEQNYN